MLIARSHVVRRSAGMYRFAAAMLATLVAVSVVVVCAMQIATPSRSERVLDALPDAVVGDYAPSGWALAEGVPALVAASDYVVLARVESTSVQLDDREFVSGTHSFGELTARLIVSDLLKDSPGRPLAMTGALPSRAAAVDVVQFAHAFQGQLLIDDKNPPLETGETYLLFLVRDPASGVLRVGDPFIHQVIDGRVYWAGAKPHLQGNDPGARHIANEPDDALLAFWGLTLKEASATVRAAAR